MDDDFFSVTSVLMKVDGERCDDVCVDESE